MKKEQENVYKGLQDEKIEPILDDRIITDPNGSYTGITTDNPLEKPIQDVDDL